MREAAAQAAERLDVVVARDARARPEAVPCEEASHHADVAEAFGVGLELVPRVEQAEGERDSVARLEVGCLHGSQSRCGHMLAGSEPLTRDSLHESVGSAQRRPEA